LKRDSRILMKRADVFSKRFALASHRAVGVNGVACDNLREFPQILALISFHESPKNMTATSFGT